MTAPRPAEEIRADLALGLPDPCRQCGQQHVAAYRLAADVEPLLERLAEVERTLAAERKFIAHLEAGRDELQRISSDEHEALAAVERERDEARATIENARTALLRYSHEGLSRVFIGHVLDLLSPTADAPVPPQPEPDADAPEPCGHCTSYREIEPGNPGIDGPAGAAIVICRRFEAGMCPVAQPEPESSFCPRDHGCSLPAGHDGACSLTAALCFCAECEAKAGR